MQQSSDSTPKLSRTAKTPTTLGFRPTPTPAPADSSDVCYFCNKRVYLMERMSANGVFFHRSCFRLGMFMVCLCVSVCVCMYVCMYVYMYVHVCMHVCMWYVCVCMHVCMYVHVCMYICMYMHVCMYVIYVCVYVCMYVCMYMYACMWYMYDCVLCMSYAAYCIMCIHYNACALDVRTYVRMHTYSFVVMYVYMHTPHGYVATVEQLVCTT